MTAVLINDCMPHCLITRPAGRTASLLGRQAALPLYQASMWHHHVPPPRHHHVAPPPTLGTPPPGTTCRTEHAPVMAAAQRP